MRLRAWMIGSIIGLLKVSFLSGCSTIHWTDLSMRTLIFTIALHASAGTTFTEEINVLVYVCLYMNAFSVNALDFDLCLHGDVLQCCTQFSWDGLPEKQVVFRLWTFAFVHSKKKTYMYFLFPWYFSVAYMIFASDRQRYWGILN